MNSNKLKRVYQSKKGWQPLAYSIWAMRLLWCSLSKTVTLNLFAERSQIQTYKLVRGPH